MSGPTYPASADVIASQPTAYQHYNNLRADALRFGAAAADAVNLGAALARYADNVNLQPLATNRLRVPYDALRPPTLMIDGYLCQAAADVDLAPSTFSGGATTWYIFANRTAGSTTFTLTANTTQTESAGQRRLANIYWDGSNLVYGSLYLYAGRPGLMYARVSRAAVQSIPNTTLTALSWDTEEVDTDNMFTAGTPTRVTIGHSGLYVATCAVVMASSLSYIALAANGTNILMQWAAGAQNSCATLKPFAAGDYLEAKVYHSAGSAQNTSTPTHLVVAALAAA